MSSVAPTDRDFMRRALEIAERGWGRVQPNPLVGAVVVRDGGIVGEGFHEEYGGPHAEPRALQQAGPEARGATLYVTLEPCRHHGKTPPCVEAILDAGIRRVVFAAADPSPVAGGGAEWLRERGVEVQEDVEGAAAREQNALFFHRVQRSAPFLTLKYALSLDAMVAERPGSRTTLSGAAAWEEVHRQRAGYDAIMIGIGTALADDPLLTVRGNVQPRTPPVRMVLDPMARLPLGSRMIAGIAEAPVWVLCGAEAPPDRRQALRKAGADVTQHPTSPSGIDPSAVLSAAWERGITSIFCEGGPRLGASLLDADLVDRLLLLYGPVVLGPAGLPAFPRPLSARFGPRWRLADVRSLDRDALVRFDRDREEG